MFLVPTLLSLGVKSLEDLQVLGGMCVTPQYGDLVRQAIGLMEGPDWAILGHTLRRLANLVGHITYMASPQALSQSHEGRSTCPLTHCPSRCSFSRLRSHRHPGINSEFFRTSCTRGLVQPHGSKAEGDEQRDAPHVV